MKALNLPAVLTYSHAWHAGQKRYQLTYYAVLSCKLHLLLLLSSKLLQTLGPNANS